MVEYPVIVIAVAPESLQINDAAVIDNPLIRNGLLVNHYVDIIVAVQFRK
jgi:hypothetical protein